MTHTFYHITLESNLDSILKNGLTPQIGVNSSLIGETHSQIYLFNSLSELTEALGNWLGELYNEGDRLSIFKIVLDLSDTHLIFQDPQTHYESYYRGVITPDMICAVFDEDDILS